jgi:hypothetical protein
MTVAFEKSGQIQTASLFLDNKETLWTQNEINNENRFSLNLFKDSVYSARLCLDKSQVPALFKAAVDTLQSSLQYKITHTLIGYSSEICGKEKSGFYGHFSELQGPGTEEN